MKISSIISSNSRRKYASEPNNFNLRPPNVKKEVNEPKGKLIIKEKKKQESSRKTSISAVLTMPKPLTVWITTNWKTLKEMGIPDHPTCLLRNLNAGQEATVRTRHGTTDCFQIGKEVHQGCILSPCLFNLCQGCILSACLFNLYAEYIMRNAGLEEAQAGIKIARGNINNLRLQMTSLLWQKVKRN